MKRLCLRSIPFSLLALAGPAWGQPTAPSDNVTINLIRLLVEQKIISKDRADALIHEAQQEAAAARAGPAPTGPAPAAVPAGTVRVPYVPEIVKRQIKEQVKQEVVAEAKAENWASPNSFPDWARRITIDGDIRLRYDRDFFGQGNAAALDFRTANAGPAFDLNAQFPYLDTTENRNRYWFRGRLGLTDQITDSVLFGFRLGAGHYSGTTRGERTVPVATSDLFGSGTTGDSVWVDQAYVTWKTPLPDLTLAGGRIANPFFSTDLVWSGDLNFDGFAATYDASVANGFSLFATLGGFPLQTTPSDFPSNSPVKQPSRDEWLAAIQIGADWRIDGTNQLKFGAAYYDYLNARGKPSDFCTTGTMTTPGQAQLQGCNTDNTRPAFLQKGNTLFPIRQLIAVPGVASPLQPEYFGLASEFRELDITAEYDALAFGSTHLIIDGDFVKNLGFNAQHVLNSGAFNNRRVLASGQSGPLESGDLGWAARVTLGQKVMAERNDWNISVAYKYIEPDAVLDAFNDYDFHLGGTNAKGFIIGGNYGLAHDTWIGIRYFSADQVFGPPSAIDVLQLDLSARF